MASAVNQPITLANLPVDVIRKIIGVGQESIGSARLISPSWNELVLEHLSKKEGLPKIGWIRVRTNKFRNKLSMRIPRQYKHYFGMKSWTYCEEEDTYNCPEALTRDIFNQNRVPEFIAQRLNRCSSVEILELELEFARNAALVNSIAGVLEGCIVEKILIEEFQRFSQEIIAAILNVLQSRSVQCLVLFSKSGVIRPFFDCADSDSFFTLAAPLVSSIHINVEDAIDGVNHLDVESFDHYWRSIETMRAEQWAMDTVIEIEPVERYKKHVKLIMTPKQ